MKKQILVVDDDLNVSKLIDFILCEDYEVIVKHNGVEAIHWLENGNDPALIISDLEMPYIDGASLIRNLKTSGFYRNTPVFLISGFDDLDSLAQRMPYQADRYLRKPFDPDEFKLSINTILEQ